MRGDACGGDGGRLGPPRVGRRGGDSPSPASSRLFTGKPSPGWCCRREEPPKPILTWGAAGGAGDPLPYARSGEAAAPRLGTSPHRARPPTALSPVPQGKLRHDTTEEQRSLST